MKRQIRKGIFETNSSSIHAITIVDDENLILPESISFRGGAFGWEQETYIDPESRASYLYTTIVDIGCVDEYVPKIKEILEKHQISFEFEQLNETKTDFLDPKHYCFVDHAYQNKTFVDVICNDEKLLLNYLFGDGSSVCTGNDNCYDDINTYPGEYPVEGKKILFEYTKGN